LRYILADELHCFPPEPIEAELERLGISYVQLLERIAAVLAKNETLFFREVSPSLPSYWAVYVQDQYPEDIKNVLLESLREPNAEGLQLWANLAPYVLKKGTTLAIETIVYERQPWVLALLKNWSTLTEQLSADGLEGAVGGAKRPMLGMVLEGERLLNKVQLLAVGAAQREGRSRGKDVPFGEVAVKLGFLSAEQLQEVLAVQRDIAVALDSPKRLGFYLLEAGVITPTQLRKALIEQRSTGAPLGQILVNMEAIDQKLLDTMLSIQRSERISSYTPELAG
jgi:hypothetical protein